MKISPELQLLLETIKVVVLKQKETTFNEVVRSSELDWKRVAKLVSYHNIRPVFFEACRRVGFRNELTDRLEYFSRHQAMRNLIAGRELPRVLTLLQSNDIEVVSYKGILFLEKLYQNNTLRESSDIDIVVKPEKAFDALKVLLSDGYVVYSKFSEIGQLSDGDLQRLMDTANGQEIGLWKEVAPDNKVYIDFHWAFSEKYRDYAFTVDELFEQSETEIFKGVSLNIPNQKSIFKMLLNHHGGRGCWLRLKDFCDLLAFRATYPDYSSDDLKDWAREMKMTRIFEVAESLCNGLFLSQSENTFEVLSSVERRIIRFWETAEYYGDKTFAKINYLNIYRQIQDVPLSWFTLTNRLVGYYAIPTKFEKQRILVFPEKWVYFNAGAKFISYFWHRFKTKKFE